MADCGERTNPLNIPMAILGVVLLGISVISRGRGRPAWWYPPTSYWMPKIMLVVVPIFGLLALVAGIEPLVIDPGGDRAAFGLVYLVLLVLFVVLSIVRLPRWLMPRWLRAEVDAKTKLFQDRQSRPRQ